MRPAAVPLLALAVVLALAAPAAASERRPTLSELESEVVCPTCETTLEQSDSPAAQRMREFIGARIAAGDTKTEIKDKLVAEFGDRVLAAPPARGFGLLAWLLPLAGLAVAAGIVGAAAWRWSRAAPPERPSAPADASRNGHGELDPELARRLDEELARFER